MTRVLTGLAAWLGGTALAVCLAWFGANMVVRDAGVSPGVQMIDAVPATPAAEPSTPPTPPAPSPSSTPTPSARPTPRSSGTAAATRPGRSAASSPAATGSATASVSPTPPVTPSATPSVTASGTVHSYTLDGGRVALLFNAGSVTLLTAVPDSGFSVQTWSGTDWLRVDFGAGPQVSSLIASWYQHAPTVTVEN